jgi:hypothetical protein
MKDREQWLKLCERAANEQDPEKLLELVIEINRLLLEREESLKANRGRNDVPESRDPQTVPTENSISTKK